VLLLVSIVKRLTNKRLTSHLKGAFMDNRSLVKEIIKDFKRLDYVVIGVGSCGTYYTLSRCLKKVYPNIKLIGVEPEDNNLIDGIGSNTKWGIKQRIKDLKTILPVKKHHLELVR
jgi:cysteine synthase